MAAINFNNEKRIETSFKKEKTIKAKAIGLDYVPAYKEYERERQENEEERITNELKRQENELEREKYFEDMQDKVESGYFAGEDGKGLEYDWENTKLGVRLEGTTKYEYVDLKGDKGEPGATGETGPKGETGDSGVYVGPEAPTNGANVWIDTDENPTNDIVTRAELEEMLGVIENGSY